MEALRWILLLAGLVFIAFLYFYGRRRRRGDPDETEPLDDDLPAFNARQWDDLDEGVGPVRIIAGGGLLADDDPDAASGTSPETGDIIVLYILPKNDTPFQGARVNSSVRALGLAFGEMNIYHFYQGERKVFSLANMHEPGSFDPDTLHEMQTGGLTVFMQINTAIGGDAMDDLTEMLQRSYQIAGLLEGRLCNHHRHALTEQDAENYRQQVRNLTGVEA